LHAVLDQYVAHYDEHRPHRARNLCPPCCSDITMTDVADLATARIRLRRILGGLINEYERAAWLPPANRDVAGQRSRQGYRTPRARAFTLVSAIALLIIACPRALGRTAGDVRAACYPVSFVSFALAVLVR